MITKVWTKEPGETADFGIDWSTELAPDDVIAASDWSNISPGIGTGVPASSFSDNATTIWITGGTLGEVYALTNTITTQGGREYIQDVELRIIPTQVDAPEYGGCVWQLDPGCLLDGWDTLSDSVRERSAAMASAALSRLTGYRVGVCPIKMRPAPQRGCAAAVPPFYGYGPSFLPHIGPAGQWVNGCYSSGPCEIVLPPPATRIDEVKVDGVVIPEADYRLDQNLHSLVWVGAGDCPWPLDQDMSKPDTEEGTFSVTYLNAYPVDALGAHAAGLLAMEFAKACTGDKKCKLPGNITTLVRQGLTIEVIGGSFPNGLTGIREVDNYTARWNVGGRPPATFFDPGAPRHRIEQWVETP